MRETPPRYKSLPNPRDYVDEDFNKEFWFQYLKTNFLVLKRANKRLHPTAYRSVFQRLCASVGTCR
jgi:hypothetical protein